MNEPIKVLVASPGYDGRFDVRFLESITATIFLAAQHNIQVVPVYLCFDSLVQRVRNNYFRIAYNNNFDVLFFIDNDIGWNPQDFVNLVLLLIRQVLDSFLRQTIEHRHHIRHSLTEQHE